MTFSGIQDGNIVGLAIEPDFEIKGAISWQRLITESMCTMIVTKEQNWIQCELGSRYIDEYIVPRAVPQLALSADCKLSDPSKLVKIMAGFQDSCFNGNNRTPSYPWFYTGGRFDPIEPEQDDSLRFLISVDQDTTYESWTKIMEQGYTFFPQFKFYYVPAVNNIDSTPNCTQGVSLLDLNPIEKEALCHQFFNVGEDKMKEAFPEFYKSYQDQIKKRPKVPKYGFLSSKDAAVESISSTDQPVQAPHSESEHTEEVK
jgi:hypothetical protein